VLSCRTVVVSGPPPQARVSSALEEALREARRTLDEAVARRTFPGGVLAIGGSRRTTRSIPFGRISYEPNSPAVRVDTLYDLASLTKVVATTPAVMVLVDEGRLNIDAPVSRYVRATGDAPTGLVTVRQLLSHSAGLPAWAPLYREVRGKEAVLSRVIGTDLEYEPGTRSQYGDLALMLVGEVVERVSSQPLSSFVGERVFAPLGMRRTMFRPNPSLRNEIAPTEQDRWRGRLVWGEVQDENAYAMGGVAGHAGLFGAAEDVARLARVMLSGGRAGSTEWVTAETIREFTTRSRVPGSSRALGWDTPGGDPHLGQGWSSSSYGHTGLTGTLVWIDPGIDFFIVLLTNRIHPSRENERFGDVRRAVCEQLVRAAAGGP
jgi:CubicO group peptidase (beta-lactamase class C family)